MKRLLLLGLSLAALGAAAPAQAATLCRAAAQPQYDIAAAAAVPAVNGSKVLPLGRAGAQKLARELGARGDICGARASARVEAAARAIEQAAARGDRATAKRLLRSLLASLKRRTPTVHRAPSIVLVTCPIDDKAKVDAKDSGAADGLRAAAAAQKAGDAGGAAQAMKAAQSSYGKWAGKSGSTPGDFASMARGAQQLGLEGLNEELIDKGRKAAEANVEKAKKVDRCTASVKDMGCQLRATAVAQLFGGEGASPEDLGTTSQAIQDRLDGKLPDDCEEWVFEMTWTSQLEGGGTWTMRWGLGKFRVSRRGGTLDGSHAAGYGPGWGGLIGNATGRCIEESDEGTIDHGPASFTGGAFRYSIGGSVTDTGLVVEVASENANVTVTAPPAVVCQLLGAFGEYVVDLFVKGPFPIEFELGPDDRSAQFSFSDGGTTFEASIRRVK